MKKNDESKYTSKNGMINFEKRSARFEKPAKEDLDKLNEILELDKNNRNKTTDNEK
ncbi:hypothetical protein [Paenibacillus kandeliae]|uniref:hypothetical protein n=1 Tax=Paenibacillus kandeliae TaxID=3231269 RepID=UPI00345B0207